MKQKWKYLILFIIMLDLYWISFFFVFKRLNIVSELMRDEKHERTGPPGITFVMPRGEDDTQAVAYYFYYPVHYTLNKIHWIYLIMDDAEFSDGI